MLHLEISRNATLGSEALFILSILEILIQNNKSQAWNMREGKARLLISRFEEGSNLSIRG
jgi:hypothetical protein